MQMCYRTVLCCLRAENVLSVTFVWQRLKAVTEFSL